MLRRLLPSSIWLLPGLALFAFWKAVYWAYAYYGCSAEGKSFDSECFAGPINVGSLAGIGWLCMVLWFPVFLGGVVKTGFSIQRRLLKQGVNVPQFSYRQALSLSPTALFVWLAVTGAGSSAALIATYPEHPTSLGGWLLVTCPWVPLWLVLSWLREQNAAQKTRQRAAGR